LSGPSAASARPVSAGRARADAEATATATASGFPVDAHVHLHPQHPLSEVLGGAVRHLRLAASPASGGEGAAGGLLLAEVGGVDVFEDLRSGRRNLEREGGWSVEPTAEAISLVLRGAGGERLVLVRGRQIVTAESLEVLALFAAVTPPDGLPLREAVDLVRESGALAVIPWGFGKWWGARGRLVRELIRAREPGALFLGDNGCRPRIGARPPLFEHARRRGVRILPGSDPLPLPGHERRAGSYGFIVERTIDLQSPAQPLQASIREPRAALRRYGRRRSLTGFVRDQIAMQSLKRSVARP